jgi:ATP-dependent Clp protease ATP-binding subunit ClpC
MLELSPGLYLAWKIAALEASEKRSDSIEVIHIMIGLLSFDKIPDNKSDEQGYKTFILEKNLFYQILTHHHFDITQTRRMLRNLVVQGSADYPDNVIHRSEECKNLFMQVGKTSGNLINSLDFFSAAINIPGAVISQVLLKNNIDIDSLTKDLTACPDPAITLPISTPGNQTAGEKESAGPSPRYKFLSKYGTEMVSQAENSMYSVFEGREGEIRLMITALGKKTKHNPIIIGEPGVGKTAIVEGLAQLIFQGKVLPGRRIFQISASAIVAGTKYRGEFEERLINIIDEATKYPEVILFFDEIHQFIGAGGSIGGVDAANILKPALSRGNLTCIGATTITEYRKYIEKDAAFNRRFQCIYVNEPSADETINILYRLKPSFEEYHHVIINEDAIRAAVEFSVRYETDRCLPDKAIDLLDESCSAISNKAITINGKDEKSGIPTAFIVDSICVAKIMSRRKMIPISQITRHDAEKFSKLETILKEKIKGQDEVVTEVANLIKISKAGMGDPNRPVGVFLFIGPTGTGKTFLAKTLAAALFSSESDLVRYDMSEFMEQHTVSKLIGSPPGYVLSEEEGILIKNLRNKPYSVVLFDEIDKAHPRILDILLQLFDEGRITDNMGRLINGRNAIFIMTSNMGGTDRKSVGFNMNEEKTSGNQIPVDLKKMFRQEFLNRINKILVFNSLSKDDITTIISDNISELFTFLKDKFNMTVQPQGDLTGYILNRCSFETFGARVVTREIDKTLKEPISQSIIDYQAQGKTISGSCLRVTVTGQKLEILIN